ncbi:hypothetical protein N7466_008152 [Penicillium verhagenii]|uniref:uncharacterized protein n=1 Tax=Penicillium verhagenii TaxID=1562060 RepID=UPI002545354F|nr:uncharacterized protein N7466_008152 [Penicillium verhagenii]KAJ5923965.1 hypothetical protein N7466_008152 [Penicillium verhagenii]
MPDMSTFFQASPPKLDLTSAHPQLFQVPASSTSSLYSLSVSRKRSRRDTGNLSSKFDFDASITTSPLFHPDRQYSGVDDFSAELDYRPNRYRESFLPPSLSASFDSGAPEHSGTSRKRSRRDSCIASPITDDDPMDSPAESRLGWGRTVINVVGKVLDLCWSGAFRGFYAGGGQGYDMTAASSPAPFNPKWQRSPNERENENQMCRTPVPGQYPEEDIDRSWVVVPTDSTDPFIEETASPCVKVRRIHQVSSPRRRQAIMPKLSKSSTLSSVRPSTPSRTSGLPSPRSKDDPDSAKMQRYAAKLRRKEREEDASMQRFNERLQAMIREGKAALNTTVEVEYEDDMDFKMS